ncbi:hypothetical protein ACROYT_G013847 [Oculina patagonica]
MIVKSAPIMKTRVKEILEKERWGMDVLKKASLDTVVNRIKYERRVHRNEKEKELIRNVTLIEDCESDHVAGDEAVQGTCGQSEDEEFQPDG